MKKNAFPSSNMVLYRIENKEKIEENLRSLNKYGNFDKVEKNVVKIFDNSTLFLRSTQKIDRMCIIFLLFLLLFLLLDIFPIL